MRFLVLLLSLNLVACSTVTLDCPSDHVVTATMGGPNIATIAAELAAVVVPALVAGGLMAKKPGALGDAPAPATHSDGTLTVKTLDLFGTQVYSCGTAPATAAVAK